MQNKSVGLFPTQNVPFHKFSRFNAESTTLFELELQLRWVPGAEETPCTIGSADVGISVAIKCQEVG